ncbi:MAG: hypothetical protein QOH67_174 [Hyphomicrobiales bacterium]|jgi:hypothetical protein|nr:hypothetical protein [Hyphomicrobiales bacterium]
MAENPSRLRRIVRKIDDILLVLWVCRVPVFSTVAGSALLVLVPQVQDLFIDAPTVEGWWAVLAVGLRAAALATAFLLFWIGLVFFAARSAVDGEHWTKRYFARTSGEPDYEALNTRFGGIAEWLPIWLGLFCFAAILLSLWLVNSDLYDAATISAAHAAKSQIVAHAIATLVAAIVFFAVAMGRSTIHNSTLGKFTKEELGRWHSGAPQPDGKTVWLAIISVVLGLLLTAAVGWVIVSPHTTFGLERATLLAFVLGAWVPAIAWLAKLSYRWEVPILVIAFLGLILVPVLFGDHIAIRLLPPPANTTQRSGLPAGTQWHLHTAVEQWARANDCELKPAPPSTGQVTVVATSLPTPSAAAKDCPRPVLVAAAGGASRAAFITAATLGTFARCHLSDIAEPRRTGLQRASAVCTAAICHLGRFGGISWRGSLCRGA